MIWSDRRNPTDEATATAMIARKSRDRSSPRWSTSDMTEPSSGMPEGGSADWGVAGTPPAAGSRRASASVIDEPGAAT